MKVCSVRFVPEPLAPPVYSVWHKHFWVRPLFRWLLHVISEDGKWRLYEAWGHVSAVCCSVNLSGRMQGKSGKSGHLGTFYEAYSDKITKTSPFPDSQNIFLGLIVAWGATEPNQLHSRENRQNGTPHPLACHRLSMSSPSHSPCHLLTRSPTHLVSNSPTQPVTLSYA